MNQIPKKLLLLVLFVGVAWMSLSSAYAQNPSGLSLTETKVLSDGTRENEEYNYRISSLGTRWRPITASYINPDATEVFRKRIPEAYIILIPEKVGVEYGVSSQDLADVAKANLQTVTPSAEFGEQSTQTVNGLDWIRFNAKVSMAGTSLVYGYSVLSKNGYQYQLLFWREGFLMDSVDDDVDKILPHFSLIDADKVFHSEDFKPISSYSDPATGFSIDLSDRSWTTWPNYELDIPQAKFTASIRNSLFLFAMPIYHEGLKPNGRDLKAAILEQLFALEASAIASTKDRLVRSDGKRHLRSSFSFPGIDLETESHAIIDIRNGEGLSYVVGGFTLETELLSELETALSLVKFSPPDDLELDVESLSQEDRLMQSQVLNTIAITMYSQNNYISAKRYLDNSLMLSQDDPVILSNYGSICANLGEFDDIIRLYEGNAEAFDEIPSFREWYAFALRNSERKEDAEEHYHAVFDTGNMSEVGLWGFLEMLTLDERWDEAISLCDDYIDFTGSQVTRQWRGTLYRDKGDFETALTKLKALKEEVPFDLSIDYDIALTYNLQENFSKAVEYIDSIGQDIDQYSFLHTLKGNSLLGLQSYVKAKESFERAIELNPLDEEARSLLEFATSALGKGDLDVNKIEIEPVPMPAELSQKLEDVTSTVDIDDESYIQYTVLSMQYEKDAVFKTSRRFKVKIGDDQTINSYSTLAFSYDPFGEEVYVNEIVVRNEDGEVVSNENREDFYVMHNEQSGIVSQDKTLHAPVQGLVKGSTLEYTVTYNWLGVTEEIPFTKEYLSFIEPAVFAAVSFAGETGNLKYHTQNGVKIEEEDDLVFWYLSDTQSFKQETHQADLDSYLPFVAIGDSAGDWESMTKEYLDEIADHLGTSDEIDELSARLVEGHKTDEEKTESIYQYIQNEFTYKALAFGPRARIPNTASQIVENKYGDCKDLALLANRLLASAGITSHLALVHTSDELINDIPSMDQFDHMILFLPEYSGGRFVDCTSRHASLDLAAPVGLADKDILVLDGESPRIINSGKQQMLENVIHSQRTISLEGNDLSVVETLKLEGVPAAYFRYYLGSLQDEDLVPSFQSLLTTLTGTRARIQDVSHSENPDSGNPLIVTFHYLLPGSVRSNDEEWTVSEMPHIWERYYLHVPFVKDRETPFSIEYPFRMSSEVSLELPESASIAKSELNKVEFENEYHRFSFESSLDVGARRYVQTSSTELSQNDFPASRFQEFQDSSQKALSELSSPLRMSKVQP